MNTGTIIAVVVFAVLFGILWKQGQIARFARFVGETREELRKCTWPNREELGGSTLVVFVTIAVLGLFTGVADFFLALFVRFLASL